MDNIETVRKLIVLPKWQYDWLDKNTPDDASKEIRRAIKAWIESKESLGRLGILSLPQRNQTK